MQFLYYLQGKENPQIDQAFLNGVTFVAEFGLAHAVHSPGVSTAQHTGKGPDGKGGLIITLPDPAANENPVQFDAEKQTWRLEPGGKYWVGMVNDAKPGPDDLRRRRMVDGHAVKLRDGNEWIVPVAKSLVRGTTLPKGLVLSDDGKKWRRKELKEYEALCRDAESVWDQISKADRVTMELQTAVRIACDALAVNYRVGELECSILELFSDVELWQVLEAVVDMPTVLKVSAEMEQKKTATAGSLQATSPPGT